MNASQSKQLLMAARKAVCFLDPDSEAYRSLETALTSVSVPARAIPKAKNLRTQWLAEDSAKGQAWRESGESVADFQARVLAHFQRGITVNGNMANDAARDRLREQKAERERLSTCACGHHATDHREDENYDRSECSVASCDCEHFHYSVDEPVKEAA